MTPASSTASNAARTMVGNTQQAMKPIPGIRKTISISPEEVQLFSKFIYNISGIYIDSSKAYLLETRLGKILENHKCESYSAFYHKIKADASKILEKQIIDAITTNETLFFRDSNPFDLLKHKILPEVIDKRASNGYQNGSLPIRIWSAACSTGQEVISIAIILKELLGGLNNYNIKLLGTDLSDAAIKQAFTTNLKSNGGCPGKGCNAILSPAATTGRLKMKSVPWRCTRRST